VSIRVYLEEMEQLVHNYIYDGQHTLFGGGINSISSYQDNNGESFVRLSSNSKENESNLSSDNIKCEDPYAPLVYNIQIIIISKLILIIWIFRGNYCSMEHKDKMYMEVPPYLTSFRLSKLKRHFILSKKFVHTIWKTI
jgi:hypothetical protein